MAAPSNRRDVSLALCLLAVGVTRHYAWDFAPVALKGIASKGLGALAALFLLCAVVWLARSMPVLVAGAMYALEEIETAVCSAWYMVDPWPIEPGQAMCSAKAGFDIGAVTILAAAVILWRLIRMPVQSPNR